MSYEKFNRPPVAEVPFSASLSLRLLSSRQEVVPLSPRRASRIYPAWLRTPHRRPNNARFVSVRSAFYPGRVFFESLLPACRFPLFFLSFFFFFYPSSPELDGPPRPSPLVLPPFFFDATLSSTAFYRPLSVFSSSILVAQNNCNYIFLAILFIIVVVVVVVSFTTTWIENIISLEQLSVLCRRYSSS